MSKLVYTIGHSTHASKWFLELLTMHGITAIADVRSRPYSRFHPRFNRERLCKASKAASIAYVFLGRELGARPEDPLCYVDGKVDYDRLARTALFQRGLARITRGMDQHRIALMCAEKDPLTCHRTILICRHLAVRGIEARHILEDGRLESHDEALARLLAELGMDERDLFQSHDAQIAAAYARREQKIAYRGAPGDSTAERRERLAPDFRRS